MNTLADHPLVQLTLARFRELWREPGSMFWVFAFPILISLALGIAFRNQEPAPVPVGVVTGPKAQATVDLLKQTPFLAPSIMDEAPARHALQAGKVQAVVFTEPLAILTDDTQQNVALTTAAVKDALERGHGRVDALSVEDRKVTGVGNRYIDFLLPGVLGMNMMSSSIWGVGWSIVQLRTRRLLKRLVATPMKRRHLLMSFVLYRLFLAVVEVVVLTLFGVAVFGVNVQGGVAAMAAVALLGVTAFSGVSLMVASRAQNSETASGLMNLATMPMMVLSGVFFSYEKFPSWTWSVIRMLPLTAFNDAMRAIINEGATLTSQAAPVAVLLAWSFVGFAVALKFFRWQ